MMSSEEEKEKSGRAVVCCDVFVALSLLPLFCVHFDLLTSVVSCVVLRVEQSENAIFSFRVKDL